MHTRPREPSTEQQAEQVAPIDAASASASTGQAPTDSLLAPTDGRGPNVPAMDRLARRVLGLRDAEPRALMDLQGSLVLSAVRCIIAYVLVPLLLPLAAWADVVATPVDLVLSTVAIMLAVRSLRRVWQANWTHRWAYTVFIGVVVALLAISVGFDLRTLAA